MEKTQCLRHTQRLGRVLKIRTTSLTTGMHQDQRVFIYMSVIQIPFFIFTYYSNFLYTHCGKMQRKPSINACIKIFSLQWSSYQNIKSSFFKIKFLFKDALLSFFNFLTLPLYGIRSFYFFYVMASGGFYSFIYIAIHSPY